MPNYQAISRQRHAGKRWLRYSSYAFAMRDSVLPLILAELPKAVMSLPIGFIEQADGFVPVAVMGLQPEKNLFVAADGRWIKSYIPAACRGYPFGLASTADGQRVLCIDEDSRLLSDGPEGEAFFDDAGEVTSTLQEIIRFLEQNEQSRQATAAACAVLRQYELIKPWPIALKTATGEQAVAGLFQIDEAALNRLPAAALEAVRNAGALTVAYCQMLSMQHLPVLGQLAAAHAQAAQQAAPPLPQKAELDIEFLKQGDTLNFGGFR